MKAWALVAMAFLLGACNTGFLQDEPPQTPAPAATPRLAPSASEADARAALEAIAAEKFSKLEEIRGEFRVVRNSSEHIWACNAWTGTTGTAGYLVVATAEMSGEVGGYHSRGSSLGYKPLPAGTTPASGACESKMRDELADTETSSDPLLP